MYVCIIIYLYDSYTYLFISLSMCVYIYISLCKMWILCIMQSIFLWVWSWTWGQRPRSSCKWAREQIWLEKEPRSPVSWKELVANRTLRCDNWKFRCRRHSRLLYWSSAGRCCCGEARGSWFCPTTISPLWWSTVQRVRRKTCQRKPLLPAKPELFFRRGGAHWV